MKIITEGTDLAMRRKAWWVGVVVTCYHCGQSSELESGDAVAIDDHCGRRGHIKTIRCPCPKCGRWMSATPSREERAALYRAAEAFGMTPEEVEAAGRQLDEDFRRCHRGWRGLKTRLRDFWLDFTLFDALLILLAIEMVALVASAFFPHR
jgi:hypothetical protein